MKFELVIHNLNNAAFGDTPEERDSEVARILSDVANMVQDGITFRPLRDINGNTVGHFRFTDDK